MYSEEQGHNLNISFMHSFELLNKNFSKDKRQNAYKVFEWMLNTLKTETGFDNKNRHNLVHKSFFIEINNQFICQKQHFKEVKVLSLFHMLKKGQKITDYLETAFKSTFLKQGCHVDTTCESKITKGQRRIQFLPKLLMFVYPVEEIQNDGKQTPEEWQEEIDLEKYILADYRDRLPVTCYRLSSVVFVKGKSGLASSNRYITFVNRKFHENKTNEDGEQWVWMKFKKGKRAVCSIDDIN